MSVANQQRNNRNNSNILLRNKEHVIIVSCDDVKQSKKYTDALGATSLSDALSVFINKETTVDQKGKALGDLILLRLILSGKIQFKQKLFGFVNAAITKDFKKLPSNRRIDKEIEELVKELESGDDIHIFNRFLTKILFVFGSSVILSSLTSIFIAFGKAQLLADNITSDIGQQREQYEILPEVGQRESILPHLTDAKDSLDKLTEQLANTQARYNANPTDAAKSSLNSVQSAFDQYTGIVNRLQSIFNSSPATPPRPLAPPEMPEFNALARKIMFQILASNNLNYIIPIVIGVIAATSYTKGQVNWQDSIISKALVITIDKFISTNDELFDILHTTKSDSLVPTPLKDDPLGMALFFKYINTLEKSKFKVQPNSNEKTLGTTILNMRTFMNKGQGDECPICFDPLIDISKYGKAVTVCEQHHKCHIKCISDWIESKSIQKATCPMCRGPIIPSLLEEITNERNRDPKKALETLWSASTRGGKRQTKRKTLKNKLKLKLKLRKKYAKHTRKH